MAAHEDISSSCRTQHTWTYKQHAESNTLTAHKRNCLLSNPTSMHAPRAPHRTAHVSQGQRRRACPSLQDFFHLPIGRGRHCRTHARRHESAKGNDVYTSSSTSRGTTLVECPVHKCDSSRDAAAAATITTSCSALEASARDSHQVWHSEPSAD